MPIEIVGRDQELASVRAFVEGAAERPAALVLEGEPGIGKSTLWLAGVEQARVQGLRVLRARPAETERGLAHVALGDLLEDVADDVLPALPAPRRHALELALLRVEQDDDAVDARALAVAMRTALELLAGEQPVLVAIDDVQWLDDSSARVLAFALRRLHGANLLLLLTRRVGEGSSPAEVETALGPDRLERLRVRPLSVGAVQRLLQTRLGMAFPRPLLVRIHETSGGNPFYALELARALAVEPAADPSEPLPVPESLEGVVHDRLAGIHGKTRAGLAVVAAAGRASRTLLRAAGVGDETLEPAFAARVIEVHREVVTFTHPLLASAFYQELLAEERRRAHRLLAGVADDPLARARHLALAAPRADADVASAVERAATEAASRGASVAAAELAEHALRLTPRTADGDRRRRAIQAARAQLLAGDGRGARARADRLLATAERGRQRAEALILMSDLEAAGSLERAITLRREALEEAEADPALRAAIHQWLGFQVRSSEGFSAAEQHARAALELAEQLGDDPLRVMSLATLGFLRFNAADPNAVGMVRRAYELAADVDAPRERLEARFLYARVLLWSGRVDHARTLLEELYGDLSERDERLSADALWYLSLVELTAGRLDLAANHAERQLEISNQYAIDHEDPLAIWVVARIAAHRGELDRARELAKRSRALAHAQPLFLAGQEGVLGLVEAWSGRPHEAVARFAAADRARYGTGVRDPSDFWWRAEYAEALLEVGRVGDAVDLLDRWAADAARLERERVLVQVSRCRGLVAAAEGDVEEALALLRRAIRQHEAVGDPFGRARALLALGIVRRRARQKRKAREAIEAAIHGFEAIGAPGWAAKAHAELGSIGGRVRERGLTSAERRVAALVAEGRTNREVAAALFLGERTVETHLSHVYAKLGVRSRTELARMYRPDEQSSGGLAISS
ncbi:MAG TPA: AAA family ATPase [Gaiellaceae bacterium]|nr:AAA family ATPase [Gaiellaceae bacterium]